jgi:hypothetical protein
MEDSRRISDEQLLAQCRVEPFRASGPGGQKRNKTSSAIRLTHRQTGLTSIGTESRSQDRNKKQALTRLRLKMATHVRKVIDPAQFPNAGMLEVSRRSAEYPAAIGTVLDVLNHVGWSVSDAAKMLGVTTGRLVSFLHNDGPALAEVNRRRKESGLRGLN